MSILLDVADVTAGYGNTTVLRGISLTLKEGKSIGLFGPNGHGKTTLLHTISGLIRPSSGTIHYMQRDISGESSANIVAKGLVHSPQGNTLFGDMGISETLELAAFTPRARTDKNLNLDYVYKLFPRLSERKKQLAKTLSGGERQMLSIGCAIMCSPKILMLDEPTLGLSPRLKKELGQAISKISLNGISMIIVEQDVEFLLSLTQRLYMIEHGEVVREIDPTDAPAHEEIMQLYFGGKQT